MILFSDFLRQGVERGLLAVAVFVDLRKAYYTVGHSRVLSKVPLYGINREELQWFESHLFDRKQFVQFDGVKSESQSVSCGVPHGSILGILLFILLINDIDLQLKHCEIILYADDAVIYCADKSCVNIESQLKIDIGQIAEWLTINNLVANLKRTKTECVLFGTYQRTSKSKPLQVKMNEQSISESQKYEYLGVILDKNFNFDEHLEKTFKKVSSRIELLSRMRQNINPHNGRNHLQSDDPSYHSLLLQYLCRHGTVPRNKLESFQDRALRIVNGNKTSGVKLPRINHIRNRLYAQEVFKCLNGIAPKAFEHYFTRNSYNINSRKNNKSIVVPKIRTETGLKTFAFQGAKIFNNLPDELQTDISLLKFKASSKITNFNF